MKLYLATHGLGMQDNTQKIRDLLYENVQWYRMIRKSKKSSLQVKKTPVLPYNKVMCYGKFYDLEKDRDKIEEMSLDYLDSLYC